MWQFLLILVLMFALRCSGIDSDILSETIRADGELSAATNGSEQLHPSENNKKSRDAQQDLVSSHSQVPIVVKEKLIEIGNLVRSGDEKTALMTIQNLPEKMRQDFRFRYLEARLLEKEKRYRDAVQALDFDFELLPSQIVSDAQMRKIALLTKIGNCSEALLLLEKIVFTSRADTIRGQFLKAQCALKTGDYEKATRDFEFLAQKGGSPLDSFELQVVTAEAYSKLGKIDVAQSILRNLLITRPEHFRSNEVQRRLRQLGGKIEFSKAEKIKRAQRFLDRRRYSRALNELNEASRPRKFGQLGTWLHIRGMAMFRSRNQYEEAAKILSEAARYKGIKAIDDEFHAARALSRADKEKEAIKDYRRFVKAHPKERKAAQAEYLAAWLEIHLGQKAGRRNMEKFLKGPGAKLSDHYSQEARWQLGFLAFERGRYRRAVAYLHEYAKRGKKGLTKGRGLYWKGRALEALGDHQQAIQVYKNAIKVESLHWYALLAHQRLLGLKVDGVSPFSKEPEGEQGWLPLPQIVLPTGVALYFLLGLDDDAESLLQKQEQEIFQQVPHSRRFEALAKAYSLIESRTQALRIAMNEQERLQAPIHSHNQWIWNAAYPRPHSKLVESIGAASNVESAYVYATMRQESGYRPRVVSPAGAIGLLQVMPDTARRVARRLKIKYEKHLLFEPSWNIRIGIGEIKAVYKIFDRNLPLSIAAYNAGAQRVRRWLAHNGEIEIDRFVEGIPFNETRNYVRRVMSHYARYKYIEDPSKLWPHIVFQKKGGEKLKRSPKSISKTRR